MFDHLCALPLRSDLFAQSIHPSEPIVAVGLSSGHVSTLKIPAEDEEQELEKPSSLGGLLRRRGSNGGNVIDTAWRTKRHKGSCRCLTYSASGNQLFSAGTDGIVKAADSETGRVTGKVAIPIVRATAREEVDPPTVMHALSPQTLLLATDSGALHIYDLRDPAPSLPIQEPKTAFLSARPSQTYHPHTDYISSLAPIPPSAASTSGFSKQWLTTGSTTLALTDLRRGVLAKSEDQEELLLSSLYISGFPTRKSSTSTGEKAIVGGGDGVITLWEKGQWDDQDERITVSREKETLDCMAHIPDGIGRAGKKIAVGMGDGQIRFVKLGANQVVGEVRHDEMEGVIAIGFDVEGRMISGGGQTLKVWREAVAGDEEDEEDEGAEGVATKRRADSASDEESDEQSDSSDEEDRDRRKRKRKRGKGAGDSGPTFNFAGLD